jgi:hypothetical protein
LGLRDPEHVTVSLFQLGRRIEAVKGLRLPIAALDQAPLLKVQGILASRTA